MINDEVENGPEISYKIGFIIIGIVAVNVLINLSIIVIVNVKKLRERFGKKEELRKEVKKEF